MKKLFLVVGLLTAAYAFAQTCVVPAPPTPPLPIRFECDLLPDGGTSVCNCRAIVPNGVQPAVYPITGAKCVTAVNIAKQMAANDNGWNDGGTP